MGHERRPPRKRTSGSPTASGPSSSGRSPGSRRSSAGSSKPPASWVTRSTSPWSPKPPSWTRTVPRRRCCSPASRRFVRTPRRRPRPTTGGPRSSSSFTPCSATRSIGGIPRSRRAALHRRVAAAEERAWGARAGEIAAELALHFELGGEDSRAVDYLQRAGDSARRRSAFREARRHYEHALELLARQPDDAARAARELDLQIGLGAATMATAGFGAPPVEAAYSRARELSQQIGDTPGRFPALFGLWLFYWGRGEVRTADGLARDLRRQAGRDPDLRLQAAHSSWSTAFSRGAFEETRRHCRTGTDAVRPRSTCRDGGRYGSHDPAVCGGMFAGRASAIMGLADESARLGEEAVTLARSLDHPFSLGLALTFRGASAQALGDHSMRRPSTPTKRRPSPASKGSV